MKRSPSPKKRSPSPKGRSRSGDRRGGARSKSGDRRRSRSGGRKRSPTPQSTKIHIGRLTRNVNKDHLQEIFATFGEIKEIEFGSERQRPWLNKGFAYIEYETHEDAQNAMKHMDGGQIDGQEISAAPVLVPRVTRRRPSPRRRSPIRGGRGGRGWSPPRGGRSPPR